VGFIGVSMKMMVMAKSSTVGAALLTAAIAAAPTYGATLYAEDFNAVGFNNRDFLSSFSDKYPSTEYAYINNYDGWFFTGDAYYAYSGADGFVLLNENDNTSASTTISGLTAGHRYNLSFDVWGDNEPGGTWTLNLAINGAQAFSLNGVDHGAGLYLGSTEIVSFVATGPSVAIDFTQANSVGGASPIIDNVTLTSVPEPSIWALMLAGFCGLGLAAWRASRKPGAV
jgi:hypothetical protein